MTATLPTSPDEETFSTPPTTPMPLFSALSDHHTGSTIGSSSSTKRGSFKPTNLQLDPSRTIAGKFQPNILLEHSNPSVRLPFVHSVPDIREQSVHRPDGMPTAESSLKSPCFVHSQLEKGATLTDWLKQGHASSPLGVSKSLGSPLLHGSSSPVNEDEEDEAYRNSLTRQLAETAVGVREMSKALGNVPLALPYHVSHTICRPCQGTFKYSEYSYHH